MLPNTLPDYEIWYTAGPMTGKPFFNYPAFREMAAALRKRGKTVISPVELDTPEIAAHAEVSPDGCLEALRKDTGETFGTILARDIILVADKVDAIAVMNGWRSSKGTKLELFVAYLCGKPVFRYPSMRRMSFASYLLQLLRDVERNG